MGNLRCFKNELKMTKKQTKALAVFLGLLTLYTFSGCGLNPTPAPGVISGADSLFAPKNSDADFVFTKSGQHYGTFRLTAYVTNAVLKTPQGGGIFRSSENLNEAPETGYSASEECGFYYYYMITDGDLHYAKVFIHTMSTNQDGIDIHFNWWLQTDAGDRNFK